MKKGIVRKDLKEFNDKSDIAALVLPDGDLNSPKYLVYDNYYKILKWNRSLRFALSVCTLAKAKEMKFKIFLLLLLASCANYSTSSNKYVPYNSKGFANILYKSDEEKSILNYLFPQQAIHGY